MSSKTTTATRVRSVLFFALVGLFALVTFDGMRAYAQQAETTSPELSDIAEQPIEHIDDTGQAARGFGYVIGDVLIQRIRIANSGANVSLNNAPTIERATTWLDRQSVNMVNENQTGTWAEISYQIINAPVSVRTTTLPALSLTTNTGTQINVPAWTFSFGPLLPENTTESDTLALLKPNKTAPASSSAKDWDLMRVFAYALIFTLLAWLAWWVWREGQDAERLPFAQAYFKIKKLGARRANNKSQAWVSLHEAMNQSAGEVITSATVPTLVANKPWLAPFNERIEQFYTESGTRFFDKSDEHSDFALFELCKYLYKAEKKHAS